MNTRGFLWAECLAFFGLIPLLLAWIQLQGGFPFFPVLLGLAGLTLWIGHRDPGVRFRPADRVPTNRRRLATLLGKALLVLLVLSALTLWIDPDLFLRLPRHRPKLWVLILLLYPLLSVAPQEYLFRTYFIQRYRPLFGDGPAMLWINAAAFAWAHVFFLNWIAPLLSLVAGLLLAATWQRTRSFRLVCLEHALYGQIVFTTGIGWFFYTGSAQAIANASGS